MKSSVSTNRNPLISVIIPVWNGAKRVGGCLDALVAQRNQGVDFEILVVDNGSTDGTAKIVRQYPGVILLHEPEPGSYRARNRGVDAANGEYVLFTDADCLAEPDWLDQAAALVQRRHEVDVHAGQIQLYREPGSGPFSVRYEELVAFNQRANVSVGWCVTANWLCRRKILQEVGCFNAELFSGGDVECSRRLKEAGRVIGYAPELVVRHPARSNFADLIEKRRRIVGGRWHLYDMKQKSIFKMASMFAVEAVRHVRRVFSADMENWAKPGVVGIVVVLMLVGLFELIRLHAGGEPHRS